MAPPVIYRLDPANISPFARSVNPGFLFRTCRQWEKTSSAVAGAVTDRPAMLEDATRRFTLRSPKLDNPKENNYINKEKLLIAKPYDTAQKSTSPIAVRRFSPDGSGS